MKLTYRTPWFAAAIFTVTVAGFDPVAPKSNVAETVLAEPAPPAMVQTVFPPLSTHVTQIGRAHV